MAEYNESIATIVSGAVREHLDPRLVALNLVSRNYEEEIVGQGQTIKVWRPGRVTTFSVTPGVDIPAAERPDGDVATLAIDKGTGFHFNVPRLTALRSSVELFAAQGKQAAIDVRKDLESQVLTEMKAQATDDGAEAAFASEAAFYNFITDVDATLDNLGVDEEQRFIVLNALDVARLTRDSRFSQADASILRTGFAGMAGGLWVYKTGSQATGTYLAGSVTATEFAHEVTDVEVYGPELRIGDKNGKGQISWGLEVFEPTLLRKGSFSFA